MKATINAVHIKTGQSVKVGEEEIGKEELEALVASRYKNRHRITETENIVYRAEIEENVNT